MEGGRAIEEVVNFWQSGKWTGYFGLGTCSADVIWKILQAVHYICWVMVPWAREEEGIG